MPELFRETATGTVLDPNLLGQEISALASQEHWVNVEIGLDITGAPDPTKDRIRIYSESAIDDVSADSAIASHPSIATAVTNTFAMSKNTNYILAERPIAAGMAVVFDVHLLLALGDASSFNVKAVDWYVLAWRETGGTVKSAVTSSLSLGEIPGLRISATGTASTIQLTMWSQKAGALTILRRDVELWAEGMIA